MIESVATPKITIEDVRRSIVGLSQEVPLLNGSSRPYINFDNAATTPAFKSVVNKTEAFLEWYASVHRGTGFKSLLSTYVYEQCRQKVLDFVGGNRDEHTVIFTGNATCAINKLCQHIRVGDDEVILVTLAEHHSNMLPWRVNCPVEYVDVFDDEGNFRCEALEKKMAESKKKIRLVAITGASNITGAMPPLGEVSRIVHEHGCELLIDAAQLIACRPVNMLTGKDPQRIDYLAFSAHKMYAPFGAGALIGRKQTFMEGAPDMVGGGTVDVVTLEDIEWTDVPEREEAGTPNLIGVVALAEAIKVLRSIGWEFITSHNRALTRKLLEGLRKIPRITIYGNSAPGSAPDRAGVVTFNAKDIPHGLLAAVLGYEWGIGVRNGCFCAQPYVAKLLGLDELGVRRYADQIREGNRTSVPGMVRVSFGIYNTEEEIDYFLKALDAVLKNGSSVSYAMNPQTGEYSPEGKDLDYGKFWHL